MSQREPATALQDAGEQSAFLNTPYSSSANFGVEAGYSLYEDLSIADVHIFVTLRSLPLENMDLLSEVLFF